MATAATIPGFQGRVYTRGEAHYEEHRYQYATSSHGQSGGMEPALILYPTGVDDVIAAVNYARAKGIAIAVRTGGHQYSGASSTAGDNIQLDMSETCKEFEWNDETGLLRTGISYGLADFNAKIKALGLFVPHGQCSHVHLGGHVQTGGYGQLGRSFGLFADHVRSFEIITADGVRRVVRIDSEDPDERDLFFAVMGGSPGNFGVLTHITVAPHRDTDHPLSRGLKVVYPYSKDRLKRLLDVMVEMSNDPQFAGDFDYCVTMLSASQLVVPHIFPDMDEHMRRDYPELYGDDMLPFWPAGILVYVQWANLGGAEQPEDHSLFEKVKDAAGIPFVSYIEEFLGKPFSGNFDLFIDEHKLRPLSELTRAWIFINVREFELPYDKRTYVTNSKTLVEDGWTDWVAGRIDEIESDLTNGCKLSVQIQNFGGPNSQYRKKASGGRTAHSWREDSTIVCVLDCFFEDEGDPAPRQTALAWQAQNDQEAVLRDHIFCTQDRRFLWGSYGDKDLSKVWDRYFDSREKYDRLCAIKARIDPSGVFTPNAFCVGGGRA